MKIHLPNRHIKETTVLDASHIQLGYIETKETNYIPKFDVNPAFTKKEKKLVRAYQVLPNDRTFFFNSNNERIPNVNLKRLGNTYVYEPKNATEFTPTMFTCQALVKKALQFADHKTYDLRVCVAETSSNLKLCNALINIFADANKRGLCPHNITVNNGAMLPQSLLQPDVTTSDFLFLEAGDGVTLPDGLDINIILSYHVGTWLLVDSFDNLLIDTAGREPNDKEGHLSPFYEETKRKTLSNKIFLDNTKHPRYIDYNHTLLYEDVLLLEKPGKGYIIVTPKDFILKNAVDNAKVIYDILWYVFAQNYYASKETQSWITDKPVDYMAYSYTKLNMYHKSINLASLLENDHYRIDNEYTLINITTSSPVQFINMAPNADLFFRKKTITDPNKEEGYISFLTTKSTIIHYKQEDINLVETPIKLSYVIQDNTPYIIVAPMHSSSQYIHTTQEQLLKIENVHKEYCICTREGYIDSDNVFVLIAKEEYSAQLHGMKIADVYIEIEDRANVLDIRIKGGGLPIAAPNDYQMIDIGNIYGRPYRLGGTMIIRLPKNCKPYEDILYKEIEKHATSADHIILVFE